MNANKVYANMMKHTCMLSMDDCKTGIKGLICALVGLICTTNSMIPVSSSPRGIVMVKRWYVNAVNNSTADAMNSIVS